jgi:hypothetical protein
MVIEFLLQTLESNMYINALLMAVIALFAYCIVSFIINLIGNKNLLGKVCFEFNEHAYFIS